MPDPAATPATAPDGPTGLELLRAVFTGPRAATGIAGLIGMRVGEIERGRVVFTAATRPEFANPMGTTHGGICATLLDSVMGCAIHTELGPGDSYATLELKVNYIRAVPLDGRLLTAVGTTVHLGRQTATAEGRVTDPDGRLVAHASTTCIVHRAPR
ncbi:thioesterase [Actinokineospora bangkokensis]|uniref:Thioesterase n=1 Tax=Actinokineospora bangkokensis TaxID=1193682 RepID=A0A1Q9LPL7_9PSEU|nr:thioesterase [Actinokineospora bangkokensis]